MSEISPARFRRALLGWYDRNRRDLPWRRTRDAWAIHVSEIMLQQTRVAAALPYYERFLARYPTAAAFARADESEILACWAGLGYYSRARNLRKAAERIAAAGAYPRDYADIRALAGVGDYTAAAIASIAFGAARAAVDGNVLRVFARVTAEKADPRAGGTRERLTRTAQALIAQGRPDDFNQALMELGATVCLPRRPHCEGCPIARWCDAHALGLQHQLPVRTPKPQTVVVVRRLLVIRRNGALLLRRVAPDSGRLAGFWELPEVEQIAGASDQKTVGEFRHTIVNTCHRCHVVMASAGRRTMPHEFRWMPLADVESVPLSTMARKALALAGVPEPERNPAGSRRV